MRVLVLLMQASSAAANLPADKHNWVRVCLQGFDPSRQGRALFAIPSMEILSLPVKKESWGMIGCSGTHSVQVAGPALSGDKRT